MKIMIVDDSSSMRRIIKNLLSEVSAEIIEAENGQDALEKIKQSTIDRFIVDINMPVMNGIEFGKKVRKLNEFKSTPIIYVTTEISPAFQKEMDVIGDTKWLNKPFDKKDLLTSLVSGKN